MSRKIIHILAAALMLLASLPLSAASRYWSSVSPLPDNLTLYGLHWDGGQFIAVGERGAILTSAGGSNWVAHPSGVTADLNGITFDGGNYLAGGGWDGTLLRSTGASLDTWQYYKTGSNHSLRSIAYNGSNLYVAVGDGDKTTGSVLVTSSDGINWIQHDANTGYPLRQVIWDSYSSQFIIVGGSQSLADGLVMTGTDGITWTHTSVGNGILHSISTNNAGRLVIVGDCIGDVEPLPSGDGVCDQSAVFWSSDNAVSWNPASSVPTIKNLRGITFGNSLFLAVGENGTILYSSDGNNWTPSSSGTTNTLHAAAWGGGQFVVAGYNTLIATTDPGISWTAGSSAVTDPLTGIATIGSGVSSGTRLAVSSTGNVYSSSDGFAWSQLATPGNTFTAVTWDGSQFIAIDSGTDIITSTNGISWTPQATGIGPDLNGIASNGTTTVVVGNNDTMLTSGNLLTWTTPTSPAPAFIGSGVRNLTGITWNGDDNEFLVVGNVDCILITTPSTCSQILSGSNDGQSWSTVSAYNYLPGNPLPIALLDIAWGGSQYVAVGNSGNVMYSSNGQAWYFPSSPDNFKILRGISWHGGQGRFIAVGDNGTIVASAGTDLIIYTDKNGTTATENTALNYTFTVQNNSDFTARNTLLTIDLPPLTDADFGAVDYRCVRASQSLTCSPNMDLANNATASFFVTVIPLAPIVHTDLNITATVSAAGPEALPSDNTLMTTNYVQSLEDKITADFNASSGGGAGLGPIGLVLLLAGWVLATVRRRMTH